MNTTVYKYRLGIADFVSIEMPQGARILSVQTQHGVPYLWAFVDTQATTAVRRFRVVSTGHPIISKDPLHHIGSYQLDGGNLVFHVFEIHPGGMIL